MPHFPFLYIYIYVSFFLQFDYYFDAGAVLGVDGWDVFDPRREYVRQGLFSAADAATGFGDAEAFEASLARASDASSSKSPTWRLYHNDLSAPHPLSDTYPEFFPVPSTYLLSHADLVQAAQHRSRQRLPAVTWYHRLRGSVLVRSSQPMTGVTGKTDWTDKQVTLPPGAAA